MIIKVDVKVAGDDEFMRCGSGKRKERIKFIKKNKKKVWRRWKMKEDDRY